MERCRNPAHKSYAYYGGRGVEFRFKNLQELKDEIGDRPDGYSLDRINTNGHYEKGNVRWATQKQQARNTRATVLNEQIAAKIREMYSRGFSQAEICAALSLLSGTVSNVILGACWND
jgi:hypothetical protein